MSIALFRLLVHLNGTSEFREILKLILINKTVVDVTNDHICKHMKSMFMCGQALSLHHSSHGKVIKFTQVLSVYMSNTQCCND
jgi:hypothetical protein